MTTTLRDVINFINSCSKEDRVRLSTELSYMNALDRDSVRVQFRVGDRVKFNPGKRGYPSVIRGVLIKKNPKTFKVRPDDGGRNWRVAISFIEKDDQPAPAPQKPGTLTQMPPPPRTPGLTPGIRLGFDDEDPPSDF